MFIAFAGRDNKWEREKTVLFGSRHCRRNHSLAICLCAGTMVELLHQILNGNLLFSVIVIATKCAIKILSGHFHSNILVFVLVHSSVVFPRSVGSVSVSINSVRSKVKIIWMMFAR